MPREQGGWFKFWMDYPTHRKILCLIRLLGPRADCYPMRLMCWLRQQEDTKGAFTGTDEVEAAARWDGNPGDLVAALQQSGILKGLTYVNWSSKGGDSVQKMLSERVRHSKYYPRKLRGDSAETTDVPSTSTSTSPERPEGPKGRKAACPDGFEAWYETYPSKVGKQAAMKAWRSLAPTEALQQILCGAVAAQKTWRRWIDGFIPNPATWLNQRRWEDEQPPDRREATAPPTAQDAMRKVLWGDEA